MKNDRSQRPARQEVRMMTKVIRIFLLIEALSFGTAALIHSGVLITGYEHVQARIAESVIAIVLLAGLVSTWMFPARSRTAGRLAQGFALFGTLVGIFTILVGVGPRTVPDVIYHIGIVIVLIWGLVVASRARPERTGERNTV
jgi:hypothetical protein